MLTVAAIGAWVAWRAAGPTAARDRRLGMITAVGAFVIFVLLLGVIIRQPIRGGSTRTPGLVWASWSPI